MTTKQTNTTAHSLFLQAVDIVGKEEFALRAGWKDATMKRYIDGYGNGKITKQAAAVAGAVLIQALMK